MDLVEENRILVKEGLKRIKNTKNPGMKALILQNKLEIEQINAYHFGFILGPCINASGRLDTARKSLELFFERGVREEALYLTAEHKLAISMINIEGLDAEVISCAEKCFFVSVPDNEGKHTAKLGK